MLLDIKTGGQRTSENYTDMALVESPDLYRQKQKNGRPFFGSMTKPTSVLASTHDMRMADFAGKKLDELLAYDRVRGSRTAKRPRAPRIQSAIGHMRRQ